MPLVLFALFTFYAWAGLDHDPPICASLCSWDDRHIPLHPATGWDGVSWTFCPGCPEATIIPIPPE
jgi:hypothetical protein